VFIDCVQMDRTTLKYITLGNDLLKRYLYNYMTVGIPSQPIHNKLVIAAEFIPMWEKVRATRSTGFLCGWRNRARNLHNRVIS